MPDKLTPTQVQDLRHHARRRWEAVFATVGAARWPGRADPAAARYQHYLPLLHRGPARRPPPGGAS